MANPSLSQQPQGSKESKRPRVPIWMPLIFLSLLNSVARTPSNCVEEGGESGILLDFRKSFKSLTIVYCVCCGFVMNRVYYVVVFYFYYYFAECFLP